jgi:chromosome segregation ATPase
MESDPKGEWVPAEEMQTLERELAEAREEIARLNKSLSNGSTIYDAVCEQRNALADACRWAQKELGKHTRPSPLDTALAAVKGGES